MNSKTRFLIFSPRRTGSMLIAETLCEALNMQNIKPIMIYNALVPVLIREPGQIIHTHEIPVFNESKYDVDLIPIISTRYDMEVVYSSCVADTIQYWHNYKSKQKPMPPSLVVPPEAFKERYNYFVDFYNTLPQLLTGRELFIDYSDLNNDPLAAVKRIFPDQPIIRNPDLIKTDWIYEKIITNFGELTEIAGKLTPLHYYDRKY